MFGSQIEPNCRSFLLLFFRWNWGLNSGLHTHKAGALPLCPLHLQSILHRLFWRWGLSNYLPRVASNHNTPNLSFPNS
jgi:hypothetical protein